jgi:hypothetical protein
MSVRTGTAYLFATVLALGSSSCSGSGAVTASINERATLTGSLPWNPLQWSVITSSIDKQAGATSVLYGNDVAVRHARSDSQENYPAASVLSLVTWEQVEDTRWFGAKIPGQAKSVEFVSVTAGPGNQAEYSYEDYEGSPLRKASSSAGRSPGSRAAYLLSRRAAVMP